MIIKEESLIEQKRIDGILDTMNKNLLILKKLQDILRDFCIPDYGRLSTGEDFLELNKQDWRIMTMYGYLLLGRLLRDTDIELNTLNGLNFNLTPDDNVYLLYSLTNNVVDIYEQLGWNCSYELYDDDEVKEILPSECELSPHIQSLYDNYSYYVFSSTDLAEYLNNSPCREYVKSVIREHEKYLFSGIGNPILKCNDFFFFSDDAVYYAEFMKMDSAFYGVSTPFQSFIILDAINKIATGGTYGRNKNGGTA